MAIFEKDKSTVITDKDAVDLSNASLSSRLSVVDFNSDEKYFFITVDKVLFANPIETIRSVLVANGFVSNLENVLSCLDSLMICIHAKIPAKEQPDSAIRVSEYLPCIRFELPQKSRIGEVLQSFYDELAKYESKSDPKGKTSQSRDTDAKKNSSLEKELSELKKNNSELEDQINLLTRQLVREQNSLSRASRALDSQQLLPENTHICRVEDVNLKKRIIKVKIFRRSVEIPTQILNRIPERKVRCLVTFDENDELPIGVLFFDKQELFSIDKRIAEVVYVEGDSFKARDLERNEFQIKALNTQEKKLIESLHRGIKVIISIADNYVVRFTNLAKNDSMLFTDNVEEQLTVYEIGRNQLVGAAASGKSTGNEDSKWNDDETDHESSIGNNDQVSGQTKTSLN